MSVEKDDFDKNNLSLKIDVEGAEWKSILYTSDAVLSKFQQITFELHELGINSESASYEEKVFALEKLANLFHVVHIHMPCYGPGIELKKRHALPGLIEITYLRKDAQFKTEPSQTIYPTRLDSANDPIYTQAPLNFYPFNIE